MLQFFSPPQFCDVAKLVIIHKKPTPNLNIDKLNKFFYIFSLGIVIF